MTAIRDGSEFETADDAIAIFAPCHPTSVGHRTICLEGRALKVDVSSEPIPTHIPSDVMTVMIWHGMRGQGVARRIEITIADPGVNFYPEAISMARIEQAAQYEMAHQRQMERARMALRRAREVIGEEGAEDGQDE